MRKWKECKELDKVIGKLVWSNAIMKIVHISGDIHKHLSVNTHTHTRISANVYISSLPSAFLTYRRNCNVMGPDTSSQGATSDSKLRSVLFSHISQKKFENIKNCI